MDGIAIPCSDDQNSLSSIPQYHQYRDLGLPQPGSTTKYRSHSGLCMPKKLPTGVVMDGIAIPCSDDQNSLSSILYTAKKAISASRGPGAPPNIARTADFVCKKAPHRCCNGWHCDPMVRRSKLAEQHLLYRQKSDFCLPWPRSIPKKQISLYDKECFHRSMAWQPVAIHANPDAIETTSFIIQSMLPTEYLT